MSTKKVPNEQGQVRQLNINDTLGELSSTFNIDLRTNPGKIKLARPLKKIALSADIGGDVLQALGHIVSGASGATKLFALTENNLYEASGDTGYETWAVSDATPANAEDMTVFKGQLVISTDDDIDAYNPDDDTFTSDWWTARGNPGLTTNNPATTVPRVLEVSRIGAESLMVTDGSEVHAYVGGIGADPVDSVTMDIGSAFIASCIKTGIRKAWVGSYTLKAEEAQVFEWDGGSTNYTQAYPVGARAVLALCVIDEVPLIITERGEIKLFNNAGFETVAQLPFSQNPNFSDLWFNPNNTLRPVHPKGIKRFGNTLYINVNFKTENDAVMDERSPNGLWALDLTTWSLTHLCSPENEQVFVRTSPILVINDAHSRIFMGGQRDADTEDVGIWAEDLDDDTMHYGHLTITEMEAQGVEDAYNSIYTKALLGPDDSVVVKYRTERYTEYPLTINGVAWASAAEFNSTDASLALVKARFDAGLFDEVEVILGAGAGRLAHITNITKSSSTYVVTIDEQIGTIGATADVRIDNFTKAPDAQSTRVKKSSMTGTKSTMAQVRVELRGKAGRPELRGIISKSENKEPIN